METSDGDVSSFLKADEVDAIVSADDTTLPPPSLDAGGVDIRRNDAILQPAGQPPGMPVTAGIDNLGSRPPLRKDAWPTAPAQPPPMAPPPPAPDSEHPMDSLSLMQLKRLVSEMPRPEPTPYTFVYEDYATFEEELEELFGYSPEERASLLRAQENFARHWSHYNGIDDGTATEYYRDGFLDWGASDLATRKGFLKQLDSALLGDSDTSRPECLECLVYLALGCWVETAGLEVPENDNQTTLENPTSGDTKYGRFSLQILRIKENLRLIAETMTIEKLFDIMHTRCSVQYTAESGATDAEANGDGNEADREQWASLTILSVLINFAIRQEAESDPSLRGLIMSTQPNILHSLTDLLAELRWDDTSISPPAKLLSLYWKSILFTFGGTSKIDAIKSELNGSNDINLDDKNEPRITASPLDYHMFRQEITSKYPAFDPPPPLFPFEPESNSILPPLQDISVRDGPSNKGIGYDNGQAGTSILHQPVHIATPAPSPPPSPAGPGGKGIKKQNYQTNQMLPFLYPPLGETSNDLGGKGSTEVQDLLVGRKWLGSDIPASILEAADLFAKRMRATRAMKQLWNERVKFIKHERGYGGFETDALGSNPNEAERERKYDEQASQETDGLIQDLKERLDAVEDFYKHALPNLQSVVIVLLKVLLQTVTTLVTQPNFLNGFQSGSGSHDQGALAAAASDGNENVETDASRAQDSTLSDLDTMRSQEIMGKAVSGTLFLLLKWFKLSHILKFEYLTQLLLDSNYIQLILKLFTHQELERVVNFKCERESVSFFTFCLSQSRHVPDAAAGEFSPSEEDSVPPPIKLNRDSEESSIPEAEIAGAHLPQELQPPPIIPEVDELGYPTSNLPTAPITDFSWRAFYSNINHLRILQKIVKAKPHRQLLMVQYKYSNILKKSLKVPQPDIRLYTLKIIKGQVPFCHRKWRQSNMRIITAIYLHCRPSLRDEWLAGIDVDQEMGEALPAEQALRALTYWHNLRLYPVEMGVANGKGMGKGDKTEAEKEARRRFEEEEQDFFVRELERMDFAAEHAYADSEERGEQVEEAVQQGAEAQGWMEPW